MSLTEEEAKSFVAAAEELQKLMSDDAQFFQKFDTNNVSICIYCSIESTFLFLILICFARSSLLRMELLV